jgi:transposase
VDFRKGIDGLATWVREAMGADPFSGTVYVFRAKRSDRVKLLFWDGSGVVLVAKRLEAGGFCWPPRQDGVVHLTGAQVSALLEARASGACRYGSGASGLSANDRHRQASAVASR